MLQVAAHLENPALCLATVCLVSPNKTADALAFLRKRRIATLSLGLSTDEEGQNHAKETKRFIRESGLLCRKGALPLACKGT